MSVRPKQFQKSSQNRGEPSQMQLAIRENSDLERARRHRDFRQAREQDIRQRARQGWTEISPRPRADDTMLHRLRQDGFVMIYYQMHVGVVHPDVFCNSAAAFLEERGYFDFSAPPPCDDPRLDHYNLKTWKRLVNELIRHLQDWYPPVWWNGSRSDDPWYEWGVFRARIVKKEAARV